MYLILRFLTFDISFLFKKLLSILYSHSKQTSNQTDYTYLMAGVVHTWVCLILLLMRRLFERALGINLIVTFEEPYQSKMSIKRNTSDFTLHYGITL